MPWLRIRARFICEALRELWADSVYILSLVGDPLNIHMVDNYTTL